MTSTTSGASPSRKDRLLREHVHDPYKSRRKPPEPTRCTGCGAVYSEGRWRWATPPAGAHEQMCPACQRIADKYPAGTVTLGGEFLRAHREELVNAARNEEARAKEEHPLQRIMAVEERGDELVITTTDTHLARGIGEALHRAYRGELDFHYAEESTVIRVSWKR